jgi:anti-sigma factor RsiW
MLCEKYKPALIEAAVTGEELTPVIRAHVAACPSCAAELAQQRSLIAAIDTNLHRQMNAPVPAAMLQRFEARLAQQPQPKRTPRLSQILAGTFATLITAALILMFLPHWKTAAPPNAKVNVASAPKPSQIQPIGLLPQAVVAEALPPQTSKHVKTRPARIIETNTSILTRPEPEVLVPADDRIAFDHFIADFDGRQALVALTKRVPIQELRVAPLDVPDIKTASLTVSPVWGSDAVVNK